MSQKVELIDADGVVQQPKEQIEQWSYFPSTIYIINKPNFLENVKIVSDEFIEKRKTETDLVDEIYPVIMTNNFFDDPRVKEFSRYILENAWDILQGQGVDMSQFTVQFTEMWTQEHYKHSLMEQHIHGYGSQLVGFYFLQCPENCSRLIVHDPRPGKVQINLPEIDPTMATYASNMINFEPKPGMLIFTNSWLPHSFGRHANNEPIQFVHFNLTLGYNSTPPVCQAKAEII